MPLDNADEDALIAELMAMPEPDPRQAVLDLIDMLSAAAWAQEGERATFAGFELEETGLVALFDFPDRRTRMPIDTDLDPIVAIIIESLS